MHQKIDIKYFLKNIQHKGFFHLLSANVMIQLFGFASQLFVAGILSPEDVGRIKIIQTYLALFSIIAGMGFNASTLKICSEGRSESDNQRYLKASIIFTITSTIIVYVIILLLNSLKVFSSDALIRWLIPLGLLPVVTNTLFMLFISYFQAIKEVKLFSNLTVMNKLLSIITILVMTYYFGIKGYYVAFNISFALMVVVAYGWMRRKILWNTDLPLKSLFEDHWKYAKSSLFANIVSEASAYIDIILLSFLISDMQEIGFYSFALTLTIALRIFPATVHQITIPYFSSFKNQKDDFIRIFKRYNILLYVVVAISLLLFVFVIPELISFIFKGKYDASYQYLVLLSIGWSIRNLIQLQSAAIFGLGKIQYNAYTSLFALIGNLIIYPISIYYFGIIGAAYASISSGLIMWMASRYYYHKAIKS